MERVEIRVLNKRAQDVSEGFLELRDGVIVLNPQESITLKNILKEQIRVPVNGNVRMVDSVQEPRVFLAHLKYQYRGGYLRASSIQEVADD